MEGAPSFFSVSMHRGLSSFFCFALKSPHLLLFRPLFLLVPCFFSVAFCATAERPSRLFDPVEASKGLEVENRSMCRWGGRGFALRDASLFSSLFQISPRKNLSTSTSSSSSHPPPPSSSSLSLSLSPSPATPNPKPESSGKLVYVDPDHGHANRCQPACNFACSPYSEASPPFHLSPTSSSGGDPTGGEMGGPTNFVMLVDRGPVGDDFSSPCKFAEKVWNAQAAGASAVLVVNYEDRHTTMEAPDDQDEVSYKYLRNITIPAAFLTKTDGQALKDLLKQREGRLRLSGLDRRPAEARGRRVGVLEQLQRPVRGGVRRPERVREGVCPGRQAA